MQKILFSFIALVITSSLQAEELYTEFLSSINPDEPYVFYSHGLIVEGDNPSPESPDFDFYEFPAIKQAVFENGGFFSSRGMAKAT